MNVFSFRKVNNRTAWFQFKRFWSFGILRRRRICLILGLIGCGLGFSPWIWKFVQCIVFEQFCYFGLPKFINCISCPSNSFCPYRKFDSIYVVLGCICLAFFYFCIFVFCLFCNTFNKIVQNSLNCSS